MTLGIACGIVFWTLVLGTAFLYFFPGGDAEPIAILQIEPAPTHPRVERLPRLRRKRRSRSKLRPTFLPDLP